MTPNAELHTVTARLPPLFTFKIIQFAHLKVERIISMMCWEFAV